LPAVVRIGRNKITIIRAIDHVADVAGVGDAMVGGDVLGFLRR
jgi:hypothetical protein